MFDIGSTELLLIIIVAIVVIGPKDLPRALYKVGQVVGKAKGMARHFRTGIDAMMREAELAELEKKWAEENRRIMAQSSALQSPDPITGTGAGEGAVDLADHPATPLPPPTGAAAPSATPDENAPDVSVTPVEKGGASA